MTGLGENFPEFQAGAQVAPADIDRYETYQIIGPAIGTFLWGTVVGTSTQAKTVVFNQILPDYPRSVSMKIVPASGSISGGTFTLTGKNQFGVVQTESFAIGTAVDGGTADGTKVFGVFTACSGTIGTSDAGNATATLYPTATGTTALFGLPAKIAGTGDIKLISFGSTGVAKAVNGGTLGDFIDTTTHAIKAPNTITTPAADLSWITVIYKPTYDNKQKTKMAAL